jgi:glycosyltransferase involved in cell wall biosynthesis
MRLLLLNQVFHPDPQATGQYLGRLAAELARRGHDVTVLTGQRDYEDPHRLYAAREKWRGVEIIRVMNTGWGGGSKAGRLVDFLTFLLSASWRGLLLGPFDVVVALTTPPLIAVLGAALSFVKRARFVHWVMDLNPDEAIAVGWLEANGLMAHLLEAASRWSLHRAARVIVADRYMRDRLRGKGLPEEKMEIIPLWSQGDVVFDAPGRERFRRAHGLADKFVVMYAGNHHPCHPLETLVGAAALLRDETRVHFCFVGGGMEWGRLRARLEGWANATFLPYQPSEELSALLSAAEVQVVVMGNPFVGIIHPCKVYNFLGARRPFIYLGPERSHVTDLIREAGLAGVTASFRHGESLAVAEYLRRRSGETAPEGPWTEATGPWTEAAALQKWLAALGA